jgi:hypothetical protein
LGIGFLGKRAGGGRRKEKREKREKKEKKEPIGIGVPRGYGPVFYFGKRITQRR